VIDLEAALRLIYVHGFSPKDVDGTEVLRLPIQDDRGKDDLISLPISRYQGL
jgi:hypothetical protein